VTTMQRSDMDIARRSGLFGWGNWGSLFRNFPGRRRRTAVTGGGCPHVLGRHLLRTSRSTQAYPDGNLRVPERRGGRLIVDQAPCVWAPGHAGDHKTADGRAWS